MHAYMNEAKYKRTHTQKQKSSQKNASNKKKEDSLYEAPTHLKGSKAILIMCMSMT